MVKISPAGLKQNLSSRLKQAKEERKATRTALAVSQLATTASLPAGLLAVNSMVNQSKSLKPDEIAKVNNAAQKVLTEVTDLGKKGVQIIDFKNGGSNTSSLPDFLYEQANPFFAIGRGRNAAFLNQDCAAASKNSVLVNKDKLPLATFHELGHAFNFNNSTFWKSMQALRVPGMGIASIMALIPAMTKEIKPEEGKELTKAQKLNNGLRKASPFIAFAAMLPTLLEEGKATLRGNKWASQLLNKDIAKKVAKGNAVGFASYAAATAGVTAAAIIARKVKDHFMDKKEAKLQEAKAQEARLQELERQQAELEEEIQQLTEE